MPLPGWPNVSLMSLSHFMSDFFCNILPVMLPVLSLRFGISYSQSAALFLLFSVSSSMLQPAIGIAADRYRLNILMPLSIATGAIFISAVGLFTSIYPVLCVVMLSGLCSAFFHPISAGIMPRLCPPRQRGLATSIYIAGGNLGAALAPLAIALYVEQFTDRMLPVLAIPALMTCALIFMRRLQANPPRSGSNTKINLGKMVSSGDFILLNGSISIKMLSHCAFATFIPLLYQALGLTPTKGACALVTYLIGAIIGGLIAGSLADRFSLKKILMLSYFLVIVTSLMFLYLDPGVSMLSFVLLFVTGAANYACIPLGVVWCQRLLPQNAAFAASMMLGFAFGVGWALTVVTGLVADFTDLVTAIAVTGTVSVLLSIALLIKVHEPQKEEPKDIDVQKALAD